MDTFEYIYIYESKYGSKSDSIKKVEKTESSKLDASVLM